MSLKIGDKAPEFKLFNTEKQEISLSDFKGRNVVILFYPLAFTSTCTAELCSVRDSLADYNELNAEVLGISVDSLFVQQRFKQENNLNFTLLSDFNREVCREYHAQYETFVHGMKGVSRRAAFVADCEGIIRYAEVLEKASELPNLEVIKETLSRLNAEVALKN